jgi:putative ABC transport system substrate-binding protein
MRRREFITLVGGAVTWPLAARAQQPVPRIGFVYPGPAGPAAVLVEALVKGLREAGFAAPAQVEIVVRSADANAALIAPLVNEVFANNVACSSPMVRQCCPSRKAEDQFRSLRSIWIGSDS